MGIKLYSNFIIIIIIICGATALEGPGPLQ
jgi:hypothetical protein